MLSRSDIEVLLGRVTYRPGWSLLCGENAEGLYLRIGCEVVNGYRSGEDVVLDVWTWPSPNDLADESAFMGWLAWRLQRVENHESREFLRLDGRLVDDPHRLI